MYVCMYVFFYVYIYRAEIGGVASQNANHF